MRNQALQGFVILFEKKQIQNSKEEEIITFCIGNKTAVSQGTVLNVK